MRGQSDSNFAFDDLCHLLIKIGYTRRRRRAVMIFQKGETLSSASGERNTEAKTNMNEARDYEIRIWYSAGKGDECYVAQVVEWPGIMAHGDTREEAAHEIQLALEGALEVAAESGVQPPSPNLAHA